MPTWIWLIFVTAIGACIGSFLNVVILRLPAGESLVSPGSRCPNCGHELAWFENIPILSWLFLRGKCRKCKSAISVQYPIIEAACAVLFALLFVVYYYTQMRPGFLHADSASTAPVFIVQLVLISGLLAATIIDSRYFIIPIVIPWLITLVALIVLPAAGGLGFLPQHLAGNDVIVPVVTSRGIGIAAGGAIGLVISLVLVQLKILPRSFDELDEQFSQKQQSTEAPAQQNSAHEQSSEQLDNYLEEYPHPRREVLKELLFVLLPVIGMIVGGWLGWHNSVSQYAHSLNDGVNSFSYEATGAVKNGSDIAIYWRVLGGVFCGYLMGGGLIWGTRILGTLGFGKEAMGLGDVHLLAAIGAVLGPVDAVYIFFIAPFLGLLAVIVMAGAAALFKERQKVIPYGPYLAGAAVVMMIFRQPIMSLFNLG